jgi:hypothetical protein
MEDRRENKRIDFADTVTYESSCSLSHEAEVSQINGQGTIANISNHGLCVITQGILKENQMVKVNLPLPGISIIIPSLAIVKWIKPDNNGYRVGMQYVM